MPDREHHAFRITPEGEEACAGDMAARFPYWSFTKTVIAICALRLADEGVLGLGDRAGAASCTLRQLLTHRSGLRDYGALPGYHAAVARGDAPWPRDLLVDRALAGGPLFPPGEGWAYSNVGYLFAREYLEARTGMGLGAIIDRLVTRPLGLDSIRLARSRADFADLHWQGASAYDPGWVYHGCLTGTAPDAARLLHHLLRGNLLPPARLAEMRVTHPIGGALSGRPWQTHGYGLGLMSGHMGAAGPAEGHSGGGPFCANAAYHFPDRGITVACFTDGPQEGPAETEAARLALTG